MEMPAAVLAAVRAELATGRTDLEAVAGSAPAGVDAGDMTAMILGMLGKVVDNAAAVSEGLAVVSSEVDEAEADVWEVDADVSDRYRAPGPL